MVSRIVTVGLLAASVYFFHQYNYLLSVLFLIIVLWRLFGYKLERFAKNLAAIAKHTELERPCNCVIKLTVGVEAVLQHDAVGALYDKLRTKGTIKEGQTKDQWTNRLVENYREKYKAEEPLEKVTFNLKNNLLWKNGEIDFNDTIYHECFIPYNDATGKEDKERSWLVPRVNVGLTIRVLIVNGIIKLQIGEFSKELSPDVIKEGLAVYKTHETITSFPLLYFSHRHSIPENYLNLSMYATDSYTEHYKHAKTDLTRDWKQVVKEVADYNYVCSVADEYVPDMHRWDKIIKQFDKKREEWLTREKFINPYARNDEDDYHDLDDNSIYYSNKYLAVSVANYKNRKEHGEKHLYTDYYEERP